MYDMIVGSFYSISCTIYTHDIYAYKVHVILKNKETLKIYRLSSICVDCRYRPAGGVQLKRYNCLDCLKSRCLVYTARTAIVKHIFKQYCVQFMLHIL